jgi:hypothetical protein
MVNPFNVNTNPLEKRTFRLHLAYFIIEGIILGVLALNEFVFIKSLKGSNIEVGLLFQASTLVLVFSVLLNEWINRVANKQRFIFITALFTRLPLIALGFFPAGIGNMADNEVYHYLFLAIFLIYYLANPIIYPVINLFLKTNYTHSNFSVLYSYATTVNKVVMLLVTFVYGLILDADGQAYRYVFPVIGVLGIISVFLFSKISHASPPIANYTGSVIKSIVTTWRNMRSVLKGNKSFRDFETSFMFYGFAFMGTVSVITIFYEKGLGLNYSSVAFYKNSFNLIAIVLLPFMGKLLGKIEPRRFSILTFASLLFYLVFTMLTEYVPWKVDISGIQIYFSLFLAMMFNGVFTATMSLLWSIGSAYYCKPDEASNYQAIHLTFTGVRSFFAPLLGVWFYELFGFTGAFLAGILFLVIAIYISMRKV